MIIYFKYAITLQVLSEIKTRNQMPNPITQSTPRTSKNLVKPADISPLPSCSSASTSKKGRRGATALITGSPYKSQLEESLARSSKSNIVAKSLSSKKCNSDNPKSKPKPNKAMQKKCSSSSASDNDIEDTDDDVDENEEDAECLYCNGLFSQDTRGDKWIRCSLCFRWCHEECAESDKKAFVCEICLDS
ncbi:hypothetical protein FQA39_LY02357 [Lamprigera yunnana]|nr:hypothetical protein FQA39_LY02357 [Lamprigera yunnana]